MNSPGKDLDVLSHWSASMFTEANAPIGDVDVTAGQKEE